MLFTRLLSPRSFLPLCIVVILWLFICVIVLMILMIGFFDFPFCPWWPTTFHLIFTIPCGIFLILLLALDAKAILLFLLRDKHSGIFSIVSCGWLRFNWCETVVDLLVLLCVFLWLGANLILNFFALSLFLNFSFFLLKLVHN